MFSLISHSRCNGGQLACSPGGNRSASRSLCGGLDGIGQAALFPSRLTRISPPSFWIVALTWPETAFRIVSVAIRVQNEHAFVDVVSQDFTPQSVSQT